MEARRITQHGKIYLKNPAHAIETQKALQNAGLKHEYFSCELMGLKIKILSTLIYYDIPQLFTARDAVGTTYLCLLIVDDEYQSQYLVVSISLERLTKLVQGHIPLRDVFEHPEISTWFVTEDFEDEFVYLIQPEFSFPTEDMLPEPGYLLHFMEEEDQTIVSEALEKDNTIVHLS